jgi:hypothetical protein
VLYLDIIALTVPALLGSTRYEREGREMEVGKLEGCEMEGRELEGCKLEGRKLDGTLALPPLLL